MKPRTIIVIKSVALGALPGSNRETKPKPKIDLDRSIRYWIAERRENERLEKIDSDRTVAPWKTLPDAT